VLEAHEALISNFPFREAVDKVWNGAINVSAVDPRAELAQMKQHYHKRVHSPWRTHNPPPPPPTPRQKPGTPPKVLRSPTRCLLPDMAEEEAALAGAARPAADLPGT
jgi:hypothetical protein